MLPNFANAYDNSSWLRLMGKFEKFRSKFAEVAPRRAKPQPPLPRELQYAHYQLFGHSQTHHTSTSGTTLVSCALKRRFQYSLAVEAYR